MSRLDSRPFEDKTLTATLYRQTPHSRLHTVLYQRLSWIRMPGLCPRCRAYLTGRNEIVDRGILGLWCTECVDG